MANNNYDVNYDDERFDQVDAEKQQAYLELDKTYGDMIDQTDKYYQDQIDFTQNWADKQTQIQNEKTDFTIEQIEQQKEQSRKDYVKEQSGAYVDWQKQSNRYGASAEQQAAAGLTGTGYSESSQVSMYNTYQNRVATARDVFNRAVLNYDNDIKDARIQNNAILAEIAAEALKEQLRLSLEGFQYKNSLIREKADKKFELDNTYYNRWKDVLDQINYENAQKESIRQFEANYKLETEKLKEQIRQFNEEIERLKKKDEQEYKLEIEKLEFQKQEAEREQKRWEEEMALRKQQPSGPVGSGNQSGSGNLNQNGSLNGGSGDEQPNQSSMTFNTQSVIDAGYAGRSSAEIERLIRQGVLGYTVKGRQIYVYVKQPKQPTKSTTPTSYRDIFEGLSSFGVGPRK